MLKLLELLVQEEKRQRCISKQNILDYLQPSFLGVLQHFDRNLVNSSFGKEEVLRSLAQIFRFVGPKFLAPLRFKILAMLQTALRLDGNSPSEVNYDVWDAFIRSSDVEVLGPQLATIFVSLLPLFITFPDKLNDLMRYVLIQHEKHVKEYIPDLFFMLELQIDNALVEIIRKYTNFEHTGLKESMQHFMKYLTHETIDVRIKALKYMKELLKRKWEELDRMILAYNGMDPIVVELIDILVLGCQGKDKVLKLMCADVIGQLGAVEPSNFPRR